MSSIGCASKGAYLQALALLGVALVHGVAVAGIFYAAPQATTSPSHQLIRASFLPGQIAPKPAAMASKENSSQPKPKPIHPRPVKAQPLLAAAPRTAIGPAPAMEVASPEMANEGAAASESDALGEEGSSIPTTDLEANPSNPAPLYPSLSTRLGEEGKVLCRVLVDENGRVKEVQLQQSSGYNRLDDSAVKALRSWTFTPAQRAGANISAWVIVPIVFSLKG